MRVLVVDAANVVGSRPTGWWRDRSGAAHRLHGQLTGADLDVDRIVLVLEGAARAGQPTGTVDGVVTVHADGSGDDEIIDQVIALGDSGHTVTVVTADRELREYIVAAGGSTVGPGWLLARLAER